MDKTFYSWITKLTTLQYTDL